MEEWRKIEMSSNRVLVRVGNVTITSVYKRDQIWGEVLQESPLWIESN